MNTERKRQALESHEDIDKKSLRLDEEGDTCDYPSLKLSLYAEGLHYCMPDQTPCCVPLPNWKNISEDQFKTWKLHTLAINETATDVDLEHLLSLLRCNATIQKLIVGGCRKEMVLSVSEVVSLKELEITMGMEKHEHFDKDFLKHTSFATVETFEFSCPNQDYLNDLSFINDNTKVVEIARNCRVKWNLLAIKRIIEMFIRGSDLENMTINFCNDVNQEVLEKFLFRKIAYKKMNLPGSPLVNFYIVRGPSGIGFIEVHANEFVFLLMKTDQELVDHTKYIRREFMLNFMENIMRKGNPSVLSRAEEVRKAE